MAKEKGFYKKYGLNVIFKEFNGSDVVDEVFNGNADFGISDFYLIQNRLEGKKVVAIMPIFEKSPLAIVSINPKINSVKNFKKHLICSPKYYLHSLITDIFFTQNNINSKSLKVKNQFFSDNSIKNRECDLYVIYETNQLYCFKKYHIPYKLFSFKDYGVNLYGDILFTSEKLRYSNPTLVENFKKATIEGWRYALSHIDESIRVILKKYNTQHFTYEKLKDEALKTKEYISNFKFNLKKIKEIKNLIKFSLRLKGDFDLVDFIYSPYIKTKKEANFIKTHKIVTINTYKWPPFLMQINRKMTGIAKDFFDIIKNNLLLKTEDKKKYAIFSLPYAKYPIAIATKKNISFIPDMDYLKGKKNSNWKRL